MSDVRFRSSDQSNTVVTVSVERLAELEFLEKNLEAIVKAAVEKNCLDCKSKCCSSSHDYSKIISKFKNYSTGPK